MDFPVEQIQKMIYEIRGQRVMLDSDLAMLSGVLNSKQAVQVNIAIMRTFTKLRSFLAMESSAEGRVDKLEQGTHKLFKIVFERLDDIEEQIAPRLSPRRRKIGLKK